MRNRALVCLSVTILFIAGCTAGSTPPAEVPPNDTPVPPAAAPPEAQATNTTIPLSQPQNPLQFTITPPGEPALPGAPIVGVPALTGILAIPNGVALNCRSGPHTAWPVVTVLSPDQGVEIAGQNQEATWWYVKNPIQPGTFCWVSADLTRVTGNVNSVPKIAVSPPPVVYPTTAPGIIKVDMGVKPDTISVPGCVGPIQPVTVWAKIQTDGELEIHVYFEDDTVGKQKSHWMYFAHPDIQDVSDSFTPKVIEGTHFVDLMIGGDTISFATYEIEC